MIQNKICYTCRNYCKTGRTGYVACQGCSNHSKWETTKPPKEKKTKPRQLNDKERNWLRMLKHLGYIYVEDVIPERWRNIHIIRVSDRSGRELDFSDMIFPSLTPLDGKVLITDFLEGKI